MPKHRSVDVSDTAKMIFACHNNCKKHTFWFDHNTSSAQPARQGNKNSMANWAAKLTHVWARKLKLWQDGHQSKVGENKN